MKTYVDYIVIGMKEHLIYPKFCVGKAFLEDNISVSAIFYLECFVYSKKSDKSSAE